MHTNDNSLPRWLAQKVEAGSITLAQAAGLSGGEISAISRLAMQAMDRKELDAAADLMGVLALCDPYESQHWRRMETIQTSMGNPELAALCRQMVEVLSDGASPSPRTAAQLAGGAS